MLSRIAPLLGVLICAASAQAQPSAQLTRGGADIHLFRPSIDSRGHITVNGSEILNHRDFSFGLMLDAGFGVVPYRGFVTDDELLAADANRVDRLVDQAFTGTLHFNYGLFDRAIVGFQLPITLLRGDAVQVPDGSGGFFYNPSSPAGDPRGLSYQGLGDLSIHTKVRLVRIAQGHVGLAAAVRLQIPTGEDREFAGEPSVALWPSLILEVRPIRRIRLSFELGYRAVFDDGTPFPVDGRSEPASVGGNATDPTVMDAGSSFVHDDQLTFGVGASFRVASSLDLVLELYGSQVADQFGTTGATSMEGVAGLKIFVQDNSYLVLGGGAGIPMDGFQAANVRAFLGFSFEPSSGDSDSDGVGDEIDRCPNEAEDIDSFLDDDGCPDLDNDEDGIPDVDDACALVPEDLDGDQDDDGCPEGPQGDRDGDGVLDVEDECPDVGEDRDGYNDEDGCPEPDNDGDGIADASDLCPNDAEDVDGFEDEDGCPDIDNDADRILDADDACPVEPETYNGFEDRDGCPDQGSVVVSDGAIMILEKIYFETDSAVIQRRSYPLIDAVAATFIGNPQILLVEVQGHADERGGDRYNINLTKARAASVVEALVQRGVMRDRLRSAGYGERCPIDDRSTSAAWERNRRVEFKIIETEDGPTGVEVACPAGRVLVPR